MDATGGKIRPYQREEGSGFAPKARVMLSEGIAHFIGLELSSEKV